MSIRSENSIFTNHLTYLMAAGLLLIIVPDGSAEVLCPRIVSEHNADVSDLQRFRQFAPWAEKEDEALAIAVWQYLCDEETGLYHMNAVYDGPDPWDEYSTVRDPIKLLNVYNVGYCGIFGPALDGIYHGLGFDRSRAFGVPGWNHCTTEVWYNGGWHYFDLDVRGALRKPDGSIASVAEAQQDRQLWIEPTPRIEPFFPKDTDLGRIFDIYRNSEIHHYYRWFQAGHVMDFRLRQGESLTRWWHPQHGRWHHHESYNRGFVRDLLQRPPRGYKSNHADFSVWTQGNGLWHYQPDLTRASDDFHDGVSQSENLTPGKHGLRLRNTGSAAAVFEVFTPWIIVPKVNRLDDASDDEQASTVTLDAASPVTLHVSLDHGGTWREVAEVAPGSSTVDLTEWVSGKYGYQLKLQTQGKTNQLILRSMAIDTWVQVAPVSLPRLQQGLNRLNFQIGDRYDQRTRPMFIRPNVADPKDLQKYVTELPEDYDPLRKTARIRGDVTLRLEAPEGTRIDWFTVGGCFKTFQGAAAKNTDNRIAYATDPEGPFEEIYRADVPTWVNHWRYQWDEDVRLDKPSQKAFIKYTGRPGVNTLRATAHLKPQHTPTEAMQVTHGYLVDGKRVEKTIDLPSPGEYQLRVDGEPQNLFIRMAVPSRRK